MPLGFKKNLPYDPSTLTGADKLALFGATLRDVSAALNGGQGDSIATSQALFAQRAQQAQQMKLRQGLAELIGGGGGIDAAQPSPPAAKSPFAPPTLVSARGVEDAPAPALPARRRGLPTLSEAGPALSAAILSGLPGADKLVDLLSKGAPDIAIGPDGEAYSKNDPSILGKRFGNPTVVNGRIVNLNDAKNTDAYIPEAPVKGAVPVYGEQGKSGPVLGWQLPSGALQTIGNVASAEAGGRAAGQAPFQVVEIKMPDGSTQQMPLNQFLTSTGQDGTAAGTGRAAPIGRSQSPADATYANVGARASADRYQTLQSVGAASNGKIANLQRIGTLLDGVEGGKLSPLGLDVAQAANSLGFKVDQKLGNKEAANALSQQIALSFKDQLPGPLSNADRSFLVNMAPGLSQSAQGRKLLIDSAVKVYQRQGDVASKARAWQQRFGRLDTPDAQGKTFDDYLGIWSERNPLFSEKQK